MPISSDATTTSPSLLGDSSVFGSSSLPSVRSRAPRTIPAPMIIEMIQEARLKNQRMKMLSLTT